ncbi:MAG: hexokinase, partial [Selenomonadaceae bacterium]|nr:hexokinase [Selenomonadaceae bacterium]
MAFNQEQFKDILAEFTIGGERLHEIAATFRQDLQLGLRDVTLSSMRMLKSYVGLPSGKETGEYLALDFGGTNIRVFLIRLDGDGKFEILKRVGRPLIVPGQYDYICKDATAEQMFDFIAEMIDDAIDGDHETKFYLGHTFSFPSTQDNLYNARLIIWTKEFATQGVEGQIANDLLVEALKRRGAANVEPVAVLNDTVAVLLSAAYKTPDTFIGSIYATGHNTCYLEPSIHDKNGVGLGGMILNLECGNFSKLVPNRFDREYDEKSEKPGEQRFEKMVSGRYMGELFGMAIAELLGEPKKRYELTSVDMSAIISDDSDTLGRATAIIMAKIGHELPLDDVKLIRELAKT